MLTTDTPAVTPTDPSGAARPASPTPHIHPARRRRERLTLWAELWQMFDEWLRYRLHIARHNYAWDYFMLLKSERAGIECDMPDPDCGARRHCDRLIEDLDQAYEDARYRLDIQQVWRIEMALLQMLPEAALRVKVLSIRAAYRNFAGEARYAEYLASKPPCNLTAPLEAVRADATDLLRGKYWYQLNSMLLERGFKSLKKLLFQHVWRGFLFVTVLTYGLLELRSTDGVLVKQLLYRAMVVLLLTGYFGTLGAVISIARRTKGFIDASLYDSDPVTRLTRKENGKTGVRLSIISGGVFAIILYCVFVSGLGGRLLQPELLPIFPTVAAGDGIAASLQATLQGMIPQNAASLATLLLWSFAAGFAEKLVPDILDRFTAIARPSRRQAETAKSVAPL